MASPGNSGWYPVLLLAPGQLVSWGTLYYGLTFLAEPIRRDTGWSLAQIFGAFSAGLLVAAVTAPLVGRLISQHGARVCLSAGSLLAALALATISASPVLPMFWLGWMLAGAAMAATLYEAAFSALREHCDGRFRQRVGALSVIGGLASTAAWPLTAWLVGVTDWRTVLVAFAGLHLLIALPLHWALPSRRGTGGSERPTRTVPDDAACTSAQATWLLAIAFALAAILAAVVSAHLAVILSAQNVDPALALWAATLIGPAQVVARVLDMTFHAAWPPRILGPVALALPSLGIALLLFAPTWPVLVILFALVYGAGHGLATVIKALAPTLLAVRGNYASLAGWLAAPTLFARALAPGLAAIVLETAGAAWLLTILLGVGVVAVLAFARAVARVPADSRRYIRSLH